MSRVKFESGDLELALRNQDISVPEVVEVLDEVVRERGRMVTMLPNGNSSELRKLLSDFLRAYEHR